MQSSQAAKGKPLPLRTSLPLYLTKNTFSKKLPILALQNSAPHKMYPKNDIKNEIERYAKNNYPKREVIDRLLRDGYDQAEIDANIAVLDIVEERNGINMFYFFPSLVYLLILVVFSLYTAYNSETVLVQFLSYASALSLVLLAVSYCRENKQSYIVTAVLQGGGFLFLVVAFFGRLFFIFTVPFLPYTIMVFGILILYFLMKGNFGLYKKKE